MTDQMQGTDTDMRNPDLSVLDYRMVAVEGTLKELLDKFEKFAHNYPTLLHLDLILKPFRDDIEDLKKERDQEKRRREQEASAIKVAITSALFSPLLSCLLTYVLVK